MLKTGCTGFVAYDPEGYDWDEDDCKRLGLSCECDTAWFAFDEQIIAAALQAANISHYHNWSEYDAGSRFDGDIDTARRIKKVLEAVQQEYGGFDIYYEEADLNCEIDASAIAQQWQISWDVGSFSTGDYAQSPEFIDASHVSVNLVVQDNEVRCCISPANVNMQELDEMIEYAIKNKFPQLPCVKVGVWNDGGDDCIIASIVLENPDRPQRLSLAHEVARLCGLTVIVP